MEDRLKKFNRKFIATQFCTSTFIFVWFYLLAFGFIDEKLWFKAGIAIVIAIIICSCLTLNRMRKKKEETLRIMTMIISIKDSPESLKKERLIYNIAYVTMFAFGLTFVRNGIFRLPSCIILALSSLFQNFANLTSQKIEYLESKPEGL
ncbi:MAG: hypothetical protein IJD80_00505 [Oscillospiraceae bacterium]|nr:hypothetical protein [Oscillospiraceae bacterium]